MNDLRHYSNRPLDLTAWRDKPQPPAPTTKPNGLWVSVGDDWMRWCRDEDYGLEHYVLEHRVGLADDASVLRVTTPVELDEFSHQFGHQYDGYLAGYIDWQAVAAAHQGIIIAPYQWERRLSMHAHWYYGWDVASGCIWDRAAIASVELAVRS